MILRATTLAISVLAAGGVCWAGQPVVGIATARGSFLVNGSDVAGNATLLEGTTVTTTRATSRLQMQGGARLELAPSAQAKVFARRAVLQKGTADFTAGAGYQLDAEGIRIQPAAMARVSVAGSRVVTIAAMRGGVKVFNDAGALVTEMEAGEAFTFDTEAETGGSTTFSGCLINVADRFVLLDDNGMTGVEVRGNMLPALAGTRIDVNGKKLFCAQPLEGTTKVIQVETVKNLPGASCTVARDRFAAAHPNIDTEKHTRKRCKVIAGIAVAGAAGGITAAVCCKEEKPPVSVQ